MYKKYILPFFLLLFVDFDGTHSKTHERLEIVSAMIIYDI